MSYAIEPAPPALIEDLWRHWGIPIVSLDRTYRPADVEGILVREGESDIKALCTWCQEGDRAEIVTLDAFPPGRGHGARALAACEHELAARGVRHVRLITTNDNWRALGFYVRHGYRLLEVHQDAMEAVFRMKPDTPRTGDDGTPLRDIWELVKSPLRAP